MPSLLRPARVVPACVAVVAMTTIGACTDDDAGAPDTDAPAADTSDGDAPGTGGLDDAAGSPDDDAAGDEQPDADDPGPEHGEAGSPEHSSLAALTSDVGEHLATRDAWAVYVHVAADAEGTSSCTGGCLDDWPILTASDELDIAGGVHEDEVGTVEREDGTEQLTYAGLPLHLYVGEEEPGQAAGHGHDDVWSVISPDGELLLDRDD